MLCGAHHPRARGGRADGRLAWSSSTGAAWSPPGTPGELVRSIRTEEIRFGAPRGLDVAGLGASLGALVREDGPGEYVVEAPPDPATIAELTAWLAEQDIPLADLRAGRKRLEDVYLALTGRDLPRWRRQEHSTPRAGGGGASPAERAAVMVRASGPGPLLAQARVEVVLTLRRGESLLLVLGIPVLLLVFFSAVDVLPTGTDDPIDFLAAGHPRPRRHVDRHGQPRHRHRLRAVVRRAQALGGHPARSPSPRGGEDGGGGAGRDRAVRHPGADRVRAGLASARQLAARPGRRWSSAPSLSPASAWRSPVVFGARSTWPSPTASTWCCSCSGAWSSRSRSSRPRWPRWPALLPSAALAEVLRSASTTGAGPRSSVGRRLLAWAVAMPLVAGRTFRWE